MNRLTMRKVIRTPVLCLVAALIFATIIASRSVLAAVFTSLEAETGGSFSGSTQIVGDGGASGGFALLFANSSSTTLPNPGSWSNVTGNLAGMASECGNLNPVSAVPNSSTVLTSVAGRGLWSNPGSGTTWTKLGSGAGSAIIESVGSWFSYDPARPGTFYESGIYHFDRGGIYKTTDNGVTFQQLGSINHNDYVSVDYTDPNRQTLLAGGHEQARVLYKSSNGGQTWTNIGTNLPAGTGISSYPVIINTQTYVVGLSDNRYGSIGIYRTTNGGTSWSLVDNTEIRGQPLVASDGSIYWQVGQFGSNQLIKSSNNGQTWTRLATGTGSITPVELPDGRIVSANNSNLVVSVNGGQSWSSFGASLPAGPVSGVTYSSGQNAFYVWHWDCGNSVLPGAIWRLR